MLDIEKHNQLVSKLIEIRQTVHRTNKDDLADIIEFYEPEKFHHWASIAENILYGESNEEALKLENLPENKRFISILEELQLLQPLLKLGVNCIKEALKMHDTEPADRRSENLQNLIAEDNISEYRTLLFHISRKSLENVRGRRRRLLLRSALHFVPEKHKFIQLPRGLDKMIVKNRNRFKEEMISALSCDFHSCDLSTYLYSRSILTNLLFGNVKDDSAKAYEKIYTLIQERLEEHEILSDIVEMGLKHEVGSHGSNLSGGQKQKLAIARTLLKKPTILLMDEATSGLDNNSQKRIQQLLEDEWHGRATLLAVVHRIDMVKNYDRIAVMKDGKIMETGTYDELLESDGVLAELVSADA